MEGIKQNALVPTYHCMHTPGGPLKYSLEGHQFAIFAMKLTSDNRYIISVSNKFITFDVVTSDLARQVYPKVEGLMIGLELSSDNKFAAAFTNNNQTILLNTLIGEFFIIDNPLSAGETVQGLVILDTNLVIYGQTTWSIFDLRGNFVKNNRYEGEGGGEILRLSMVDTLDNYSVLTWRGDSEIPAVTLQTYRANIPANPLEGHSALALNTKQTRAFICGAGEPQGSSNHQVSSFVYKEGFWVREKNFQENAEIILMLEISKTETWCMATLQNGFKLWKIETGREVELKLPAGVRNISKSHNNSSSLVLSKNDVLAVSGIRQEIIVWDMDTGSLVKRLVAHFQRIVEIKSLGKKQSDI